MLGCTTYQLCFNDWHGLQCFKHPLPPPFLNISKRMYVNAIIPSSISMKPLDYANTKIIPKPKPKHQTYKRSLNAPTTSIKPLG